MRSRTRMTVTAVSVARTEMIMHVNNKKKKLVEFIVIVIPERRFANLERGMAFGESSFLI